ncbi:unnamed protein product [Closterium sp. NIES-53]
MARVITVSLLFCAVLCCAVLCAFHSVLCCAALCAFHSVLFCAVLCCAVLCCAVLCCAVLCCAVLCCAVLCCTVLCFLCCAALCVCCSLCVLLSVCAAPSSLLLCISFCFSSCYLTIQTDPVTNPQAQEPSSSSSSSSTTTTISANAATAATAGNAAMWSSEATDLEECGGVLRELVEAIREDYEQRAYFVTGDISARFYDAACLFADPTIQFSGLRRWQRNISLLTRFFSAPTIHLHDLQVFPATPSSAARLETRWRLLTPINLPWGPLVDIQGSTVHTLNAAGTKVVSHVEAWDVSAYEAIMQLFRPGPPAPPSPPNPPGRPESPSAPGSP